MRIPADIAGMVSRYQTSQRRLVLFTFQRDVARSVPLSPGSGVTIGRDADVDLQILDHSLSRRHARFFVIDDRAFVEDLGSTNGTRVGDKPIERCEIALGQEVWLGSIVAFVHEVAAGKTITKSASVTPAIDPYDAFLDQLAAEIVRAQYFGRAVTLLTIRVLQRDGGSTLRHFCARLREELRPIDRLAVYSADSAELLLPEMTRPQAISFVQSLLQKGGDMKSVVYGLATRGGGLDTADKLVEASRCAAREATDREPLRVAPEGEGENWSGQAPPSQPDAGVGPGSSSPSSRLAGKSAAMMAVEETATRLARSQIPVLLLGETGVGKEVLARRIHDASPRRDKPMVCVNCAAIPPHLIESTLFGHEKGAFTGAIAQQKGVFEAADGGTVLLDELGELPQPAQAALLRVLETRRICRVGSTRELSVNVRLIAATHRDLETMVASGEFRSDLLYRLNTMILQIPPLRARREDIEPLATNFLVLANKVNGTQVRAIEPAAMQMLSAYSWPGNIRELRNAIERATVISDGEFIRTTDLPDRVRAASSMAMAIGPAPVPDVMATKPENAEIEPLIAPDELSQYDATGGSFREQIDRYEARLLLQALRAAEWNQTTTARLLGLPRRTLQHKIKAHGIRRLGYAVVDTEKDADE